MPVDGVFLRADGGCADFTAIAAVARDWHATCVYCFAPSVACDTGATGRNWNRGRPERTLGERGAGSEGTAGPVSLSADRGCTCCQNTKPRETGALCLVGADVRQGRNRGDPDFLADIDIELPRRHRFGSDCDAAGHLRRLDCLSFLRMQVFQRSWTWTGRPWRFCEGCRAGAAGRDCTGWRGATTAGRAC